MHSCDLPYILLTAHPSGMVSSILPYSDADGNYLIAGIKADGVGFVAANQDGSGRDAAFGDVTGLAVSPNGKTLYVS